MESLIMSPRPGERAQKFVGDQVRFSLSMPHVGVPPKGWKAFLRTTLGRGKLVRQEILHAHFRKLPLAGACWRDIPMLLTADGWQLDLALAEVGYFRAKAYAVDEQGRQVWPPGPDFGISIHPDAYRTANILYCAFPRLFGSTRFCKTTESPAEEKLFQPYDQQGYTIIPPSGKLRDLTRQLDHIVDRLGCRILHLLPINPTPTVFARYGRYGSPYAVQDLAGIDLSLVEYDRRTTGIEQFEELTYAAHARGAKVFLDIVINHTGWGAMLQENHPEWFLRDEKGDFISPGAWGTIWEDLSELDHRFPALWDYLADVFIIWCRRGVDGFRCDAGYKVPVPAWQYIVAKVQEEFPETIFFLEGLGGAWEATENLLTEGGMQWAYSELFQNFSPEQIAGYLDHSFKQSARVGALIHYSETHDNDRLAKKGKTWSLLRNLTCGLTSVSGGFGFTCGVEWLAEEKIRVHGCTGLSWDNPQNIVAALSEMHRLLADHPCFFDGAVCERVSEFNSQIYALKRTSAEGKDQLLILINTDLEKPGSFLFSEKEYQELGSPAFDLLSKVRQNFHPAKNSLQLKIAPGQVLCLGPGVEPNGLSGEAYRQARARAAWALEAIHSQFSVKDVGQFDWLSLSKLVDRDPARYLGALSQIMLVHSQSDILEELKMVFSEDKYQPVCHWTLADRSRLFMVPPHHWLLVEDFKPFKLSLETESLPHPIRKNAVKANGHWVVALPPHNPCEQGRLRLERYDTKNRQVVGDLIFLPAEPTLNSPWLGDLTETASCDSLNAEISSVDQDFLQGHPLVLLTNGIGGMARIRIDLGSVRSKYDCVLAANLHAEVPVDRHVFIKRMRAWINADGFISPLNGDNLVHFLAGPPARWVFLANAGDGRCVEVHLTIDMVQGENATIIQASRPNHAPEHGRRLPPDRDVKLVVRFDIEDRNFHCETKYNDGAAHHFSSHTKVLPDVCGFAFEPAPDRKLSVQASAGKYHSQPEWSYHLPHPVEASRGQEGAGDAYSPGWFDIPLGAGEAVLLFASASKKNLSLESFRNFEEEAYRRNQALIAQAKLSGAFAQRLVMASAAFVVRRNQGKTIIAGYPWFLDWGRDSLICARGLLSAGFIEEVRQLLIVFGRFEKEGTLPNTIHGEDASNRDTTDAPLWFGVVCDELSRLAEHENFLQTEVDQRGRTIAQVLASIATHYMRGTPNGIGMDRASGLIWSPSHFTWMDTNFPAGTPREGYPVEIQVLWMKLLELLARLKVPAVDEPWEGLLSRTREHFFRFFWMEQEGWFADCLLGVKGTEARSAIIDRSLRSNFLIGISLGVITGEQAKRSVAAAAQWLIVPGACRTLAPLPVEPPMPIHSNDGRLLNNPLEPYRGRYEGDEDTCRKPAYHNGTAWTWTYPHFCEALARAWDLEPAAVAAARAYLASAERLLGNGCVGQLPEIVDGDFPHQERGCDAQAWGATEVLRAWAFLETLRPTDQAVVSSPPTKSRKQ